MKKIIPTSLVLICAMVWPVRASLLSVQETGKKAIAAEKLPSVSVTESPVQKVSLGALASSEEISVPQEEMVLSLNSSLDQQGSPLASTELRINLDNFDMEYVLKVQ